MKYPVSRIALVAALLLAGCGGAIAGVPTAPDAGRTGPAGDYPMVLGAPFVVEGITYTPADTLNYDSVGYAQVSGDSGISGAHRTLPLPSYVEVTSLESGRTILVRLTERGPMTGSDLVTLSAQAWAQLGATPGSRLPVRVRRVNPPEAERALLRAGAQAPARMDTPPGLLAALKRKLGLPIAPTGGAVLPDTAATPVKPAATLPAKPQPAKIDTPVAKPSAVKSVSAKPAVPQPVSQAPVKTIPAAKTYHVQVGTYSTRSRAEAAGKATGGAVAAAGKLWRVRLGPIKDSGQAAAALAKVRAGGYADAMVVTAP
ncbi:MAG: SPOR domain-containing protein [Novosphingobium sp.]